MKQSPVDSDPSDMKVKKQSTLSSSLQSGVASTLPLCKESSAWTWNGSIYSLFVPEMPSHVLIGWPLLNQSARFLNKWVYAHLLTPVRCCVRVCVFSLSVSVVCTSVDFSSSSRMMNGRTFLFSVSLCPSTPPTPHTLKISTFIPTLNQHPGSLEKSNKNSM